MREKLELATDAALSLSVAIHELDHLAAIEPYGKPWTDSHFEVVESVRLGVEATKAALTDDVYGALHEVHAGKTAKLSGVTGLCYAEVAVDIAEQILAAIDALDDTLGLAHNWPRAAERIRNRPEYEFLNLTAELTNEVLWACKRLTEEANAELSVAESAADTEMPVKFTPVWNCETGELRYGGEVVKHIKNLGTAKGVVAILNAFGECEWQARIDDPIPGGKDPERLRDTIRSLNKSLSAIRFSPDGTGAGIRWEPLS